MNFLSPDVVNYNLENGPIDMTQSRVNYQTQTPETWNPTTQLHFLQKEESA